MGKTSHGGNRTSVLEGMHAARAEPSPSVTAMWHSGAGNKTPTSEFAITHNPFVSLGIAFSKTCTYQLPLACVQVKGTHISLLRNSWLTYFFTNKLKTHIKQLKHCHKHNILAIMNFNYLLLHAAALATAIWNELRDMAATFPFHTLQQ